MSVLKKSPFKVFKHNKVDPEHHVSSGSSLFDSNDYLDTKKTLQPSKEPSSKANLISSNVSNNPFDDEEERVPTSSSSFSLISSRNKYKNDFRDSGGLENQSVQELENYAGYKAEETTKSVYGCLKIASEIREDATKTLVTLHQQGEQITRAHNVAVEMDHDLSRGEKLLGNLGGMFSKTWKPKKNRRIKGPVITGDGTTKIGGSHMEQREKLGLNHAPKGRSSKRTPPPEPTDAFQKVEIEKLKQDDALSDLSDILGELKNMAVDMGTEIDRHTKALDYFQDDVDELNFRVRGANQRGRKLLGK